MNQEKKYIFCPNPYSKKQQNPQQQNIYDKIFYPCEYCHALFDNSSILHKHEAIRARCKHCSSLIPLCLLNLHENFICAFREY